MVINTLKHNYYVIHKLMENDIQENFLCCEENRADGLNTSSDTDNTARERFQVIRLKDKELTYRLISFFMELTKHTVFTDYYDCFSKDGYLHLVFRYNDYQTLAHKLDYERCELRERIEIGKTLLTNILMLNMPDFILLDALTEDNVTVSASLGVFFNYNLLSLQKHGEIGISEVKNRLTVIFKHLFEYELAREASVDIEDFIEELKSEDFKNYFEIFKKYEELYDKLLAGDLIQRLKPNTFLFRLWDRIKSLGKYVKPVVSIIIVLLIAGYLIYTILHKKVDPATVFNFEQIGTVTITDSGNSGTTEAGEPTMQP